MRRCRHHSAKHTRLLTIYGYAFYSTSMLSIQIPYLGNANSRSRTPNKRTHMERERLTIPDNLLLVGANIDNVRTKKGVEVKNCPKFANEQDILRGVDIWKKGCVKSRAFLLRRCACFPSPSCASHGLLYPQIPPPIDDSRVVWTD